MNKCEVLDYLRKSPLNRVRHNYYSDDEWLSIDSDGNFKTEDGYTHGGVNDEFWRSYQKWDQNWSIVESDESERVDRRDFSGTHFNERGNTISVTNVNKSDNVNYDFSFSNRISFESNSENERNSSPIFMSKNGHKRTNKRR